jgi:CRISPR-associated protein Cas1
VRLANRAVLIEKDREVVGKIPVEDIAVLVLDGPDLLLSHQILGFCAEHGVAVVTSDEKHMPNGLHLPLSGHTLHSATLRSQIEASAPSMKRTWQTIVKAKIRSQAKALEYCELPGEQLRRLASMVRSGDPDNVEARAAARFFDAMFGAQFIRDRDAPGLNACLNYGYAIVRSAVARSIVGAGLHPALGVHHHNQYNAFCLADDAMEPFRSMVDVQVWRMSRLGEVTDELKPATKRALVGVLGRHVIIDGMRYPFLVGLERYAAGLRRAVCEGDLMPVAIPAFEHRE